MLVVQWVSLKPVKAVKLIAKLGQDYDDGSTGVSGFVVSSVVWSLYSFLVSPSNFVNTIVVAVSAGGDTDSTAAMAGMLCCSVVVVVAVIAVVIEVIIAGCISGAYNVVSGIPVCFRDAVNDKGTWKLEELTNLALQCHQLKQKQQQQQHQQQLQS